MRSLHTAETLKGLSLLLREVRPEKSTTKAEEEAFLTWTGFKLEKRKASS